MAVSGAGGRLAHTTTAVEAAARVPQLWAAKGEKPHSRTLEPPVPPCAPEGPPAPKGMSPVLGSRAAVWLEETDQHKTSGTGRAAWLCLSSCRPLGAASSPWGAATTPQSKLFGSEDLPFSEVKYLDPGGGMSCFAMAWFLGRWWDEKHRSQKAATLYYGNLCFHLGPLSENNANS